MKNQPTTMKNHKNSPGTLKKLKPTWIYEKTNLEPKKTMKTQLESWKPTCKHINHENQTGAIKNQPGTMKNHEKPACNQEKYNLEPKKTIKTWQEPWKPTCKHEKPSILCDNFYYPF